MVSLITKGVEIIVNSSYEAEFSDIKSAVFVFSYQISIKNGNDFPIQILSRKWNVQDSNGEKTVVEGEGVVGEQPFINPDDSFDYDSGTTLKSGIGKMYGYYIAKNVITNEKFKVTIPEFDLLAEFCLN